MLTALALGLAGCQVDDIEAAEANKINTDGIFADYFTKINYFSNLLSKNALQA